MSDKLECSAPSINLHQFDKECHVCGFVACHAQLQLRNSEISLLQLKLVCLGCSKSRLTSRSTYYLWLYNGTTVEPLWDKAPFLGEHSQNRRGYCEFQNNAQIHFFLQMFFLRCEKSKSFFLVRNKTSLMRQ